MSTKRAKTKASKPSPKPKVVEEREGHPLVHAPAPPHRLPGQPLTLFDYKVDRSLFDVEFHPQDFIQHCREGATKFEICAAWGISQTTLDSWIEKYPQMKRAYEIGKPAQQAWLATKIRRNLDNKGANAALLIFSAKNLLGWGEQAKTDFDDIQDVEVDFDVKEREKE